MKVLITGGAGFIGSHLAEQLLTLDHEVTVLDNLSTGSRDNVAHLLSNANFRLFVDSVTNEGLTRHLVRDCDIVYHLAAAVGVQLIVRSPVHTIETNVHGTEVVLRMAAEFDKKVLVASTSEVYGKSTALPFAEDGDIVLGPSTKGRWAYACSKALDEFLGLSYWKEKSVPTCIVRLFNTVGPRQTGQYGMVIPRFVKQALAGEPITVYGDGEQSRCFCNVTDIVTALQAIMAEPACVGEVFNLGSQEEISIKNLALLVKRLAQSDSEVTYIPYSQAYEAGFEDMRRRVPDTSKAQRVIGFEVTKTLERTVLEVIEHYARTA